MNISKFRILVNKKSNKKKVLWIILGIPSVLQLIHATNNLYLFYRYSQIADTLDCDNLYSGQPWTKVEHLCFSPNAFLGSLWLIAIALLVLTLLIRYSRKK